ncbi:hypothetical protein Cgig2_003069 [Carnegiea gigantea]|uniref:Uncharacterized protein n=1 Tax=Carnegiea gigantea TaxID=171969 RepID=A0A9Q1JPS8_9CARY|nr:hypothetical protein Cgig2_003069 [Carnegiea gigantea]
MGFPRSLMMDEMALYILGNFKWYRREVVFPPLQLPSGYKELCLDFVLVEAEKYARNYEVPELPQVVFLEMLLNGAMKLSILCGWTIEIMESALTELRWSTMYHVRETFKWHLRRASRPPRPLSEDYRDLYLSFTLFDAEEAVCDFNIPEIVQATFYTMLLNDVVELSVVSRDMAGGLKSTYKGLRWTTFESWLSVSKRALLDAQLRQRVPLKFLNTKQAADYVRTTFMWCLRELVRPPQSLLEDYCDLCPHFNLEVVEASAWDSHIPELTQVVFYAIVLNDVVALGVSCVIMADTLTPVLEWLN